MYVDQNQLNPHKVINKNDSVLIVGNEKTNDEQIVGETLNHNYRIVPKEDQIQVVEDFLNAHP
jgi:hypothetical protein